jgi:hypothetical protein
MAQRLPGTGGLSSDAAPTGGWRCDRCHLQFDTSALLATHTKKFCSDSSWSDVEKLQEASATGAAWRSGAFERRACEPRLPTCSMTEQASRGADGKVAVTFDEVKRYLQDRSTLVDAPVGAFSLAQLRRDFQVGAASSALGSQPI